VSFALTTRKLLPEPRDVLAAQGVPPGAPVSSRLEALVEDALALLSESAEPKGVIEPIPAEEFAAVLQGMGQNAEDPVVGWIYPRADGLALFAATLGPRVTDEIQDLFATDDVPLAVSLDAAASRMAENAAGALSKTFSKRIAHDTDRTGEIHVLGYSPGYCGWHVTGQHALFRRLRPERIGITLADSALMHPLKSVSGVLIAGGAALHTFETGFTYCSACRDKSCVARMRSLEPTSNEPHHR
jgi:hypothetical protein